MLPIALAFALSSPPSFSPPTASATGQEHQLADRAAPAREFGLASIAEAHPAATRDCVVGDEPPPGPPWQRTYATAVQRALQKGQVVFVYFTKTH